MRIGMITAKLSRLLAGGALLALSLTACGGGETTGGPQSLYDDALRFDLPVGWHLHADPIQVLCLGQTGHIVVSSGEIPVAQFYATRDVADDASGGTIVVGELLPFERQRGPQEPLRNYLLYLGDAVDETAVEFLTINDQPAARLVSAVTPERINYTVSVFVDDAILVLMLFTGNTTDQPHFDALATSLVVDGTILLPLLTRPAPVS
jgi:hypothetical protein